MSQEWIGRRKFERSVLNLKGQAVFLDGSHDPIDVTVIDISKMGARVEFPEPGPYPAEFKIEIPARKIDCFANVRWQRDNQVGVEFASSRTEDSLDSLVTRVRSLERRLSALETGSTSTLASTDVSPMLDRLDEIEAQLADKTGQVPASGQDVASPATDTAALGLLEAKLQARLTDLETRLQDVQASAQDAQFDREIAQSAQLNDPSMLDRLMRLEWRLEEVCDELKHSRPSEAPAPAPAPVDPATPELARQILYMGERLAGLEAAFQEKLLTQSFDTLAPAPLRLVPTSFGSDQDAGNALELGTSVLQLAGRVERMSRDMVQMQDYLYAQPQAPTVSHTPSPPPEPEVRSLHESDAVQEVRAEVAELKSSLEALIMALSLGLGRAAA